MRAAWLVVLAACEVTDPAGSDAGPMVHGIVDGGIELVDLAVIDSVEAPVVDASVCYLLGPGGCVAVGADGIAKVPVDPSGPATFALLGSKDGYHATLLLETSSDLIGPMRLATDAEAQARYGGAFHYPDDGNGFVEISLAGADTAGTVVSMAGHAPVYADAHGALDPSLTSATSSGRVVFGNLPPGRYELTAVHAGKHCAVGTGHNGAPIGGDWPATDGGDVAFEVAAGATTALVSMACQ